MSVTVKDTLVRLSTDNTRLNAGYNAAQKKTASFAKDTVNQFKKIKQFVSGALIGGAVTTYLASAAKASIDAAETIDKFGVVFKKVMPDASAAVADLTKNYGLSKVAAHDMLAATGDLLSGVGASSSAALDLSKSTQNLAVDLASFTNAQGGAKRASEAITKAMLGEREMLKAYGIVVSEEMIKQHLREKGQDKLTGSALLQAKAYATLAIATTQSKNAIGNYALTADSAANTIKRIGAEFENFQVAVGDSITKSDVFKEALAGIESTLTDPGFQKGIATLVSGLVSTVGAIIEVSAAVIKLTAALAPIGIALAAAFAVSKIKAWAAGFEVLSMAITGSNAMLVTQIGLLNAAAIAQKLLGKALPLIAVAAAIKVFTVINDKLKELSKVSDQVSNSFVNQANAEKVAADKFRAFRDEVGMSSAAVINITKSFRDSETGVTNYNRVMMAIASGKYGGKLAEDYKKWNKEQFEAKKKARELKAAVDPLADAQKKLTATVKDASLGMVPHARFAFDIAAKYDRYGISILPVNANLGKHVQLLPEAKTGLENVGKTIVSTTEKLETLSGILGRFGANLGGIGVISKGASNMISTVAGSISGVGQGIKETKKSTGGLLGTLGKVGGVVGIAASAISGLVAVIGFLGGPSGELEAARRRMAGLPGVTRDWTEDIEKLAQELGGAGSAARAFNQMLPDIIRDSNITINTFDAWIEKVREIVSSYEQGTASIYETQKNFGAAFDAMREKAVELGIEGSKAMIGLILEAEEFGLNVKEISEYTSNNMTSATKGWMKVLEEMGGVSIPILDEQVRLLKVIESIPEGIAAEIEGATASLIGMSNVSEVLPEDFAQFGLVVDDVRGKLEAQGKSNADIAYAMKPLLERMIFLSQEYGYTIDDNTQAIINEGVAAGHLSTDIRTDGQKSLDIQGKILDVLGRLEKGFFGISDAVGEFGRAGEKAFFHMDSAATGWKKTMQDVIDTTEDATDAIADMGGMHDDVMFGHSIVPDIETWIDKLGDVTSSLDGDVVAAIAKMGSVHAVISSGMYSDNEELQSQLSAMVDDIRDLYSQAGADLFSQNYAAGSYSRYGINNEEQVSGMSMQFEELQDLWYNFGGDLVQDIDGFGAYVNDLKNLTVADELQDDFDWFISEMDKWQDRLEAGDIWDVDSQSWIVPEAPASFDVDTESLSSAFSSLMSKAKSFGLEGTAAMIDLMNTSKLLGVNVKEIEAYQKAQMKSAADGWRKVLSEFDGAALPSLSRIIDMEDRYAALPEGLRGEIEGAAQALTGLSNARKLTTNEFDQFELVGLDMIQKLSDQGVEGNAAIPMMSDFLERMNMLSQEYGYDLDPAIQALIDTGLANGTLSDDIRTDTQKSVTLQEEMVDHLKDIAAKLGAAGFFGEQDIPGFATGTGGTLPIPGSFIVGEYGPELMETGGGGLRVTPLGGSSTGGGSGGGDVRRIMEFNINITPEQGLDAVTLSRTFRTMMEYNPGSIVQFMEKKINE